MFNGVCFALRSFTTCACESSSKQVIMSASAGAMIISPHAPPSCVPDLLGSEGEDCTYAGKSISLQLLEKKATATY